MLSQRACQVLVRAQEMLSRRGGWKQGGFGPIWQPDAPHCAVGAIRCAAQEAGLSHGGTIVTECIRALAAALPPAAVKKSAAFDSIFIYNDAPQRRKGDVVKLFKTARDQGGCEEAPSTDS